jgi:hypothetical protein
VKTIIEKNGERIEYEEEEVDLSRFPTNISKLSKGDEVTIGDLHGNTIKGVWFLLKEGVIEMDVADYDALYLIYSKDITAITDKDLNDFKRILKKITVTKEQVTVRFLGDIFCDRGKCDWFTLLLFKHVLSLILNLEVIFSNHDAYFISIFYETWKGILGPKLPVYLMTRCGPQSICSS